MFNRFIGGREAIVADQACTTRDRHFGDAVWNGRAFWIVDTGGMVPDSDDSMDRAIRRQAEVAINEADLILFVVDGKEGLHPIDQAIAGHLRKAQRPVVLVVNKLDKMPVETFDPEFCKLGLGEPVPVSAAVGKASGDLLDIVVEKLPPAAENEGQDEVAIAIGAHQRRQVLARQPAPRRRPLRRVAGRGTTRDAVDSILNYHGRTLRFVDTVTSGGKSRVDDDVEFYSTVRTRRAIEAAQVCILVVDASIGVHHQDLRIATEAWDRGAGLVVAVNKWDLVEEKDANTAVRGHAIVTEKAPFLADVPFVYLSATTGQRARKVLDTVLEVAEARERRVATAEVNKVLEALVAWNQPP
ncbi:MAG: GTP-binding protein [Gemmatimonadales bacterium]